MTVKVYVSDHCSACESIKENLGRLAAANPDVEIVSIDTDAGFDDFARATDLDNQEDGAGVPSAYCDGKPCKILRGDDNDKIALRCDGRLIGASEDEVEN